MRSLIARGGVLAAALATSAAEAVAIKDGRIVAVGARATVERTHRGPTTRVIDLAGRTMIPGFIDAHGHMWGAGALAMAANRPGSAPTASGASIRRGALSASSHTGRTAR
jgi:hypothetical protein